MELFVIIVHGFHLLTIITNCSILDIAAVLDPPLNIWNIISKDIDSSKYDDFLLLGDFNSKLTESHEIFLPNT